MGDIILSRKPETWDDFCAAIQDISVPTDLLDKKERNQVIQQRNSLEAWCE